jgi:SAM-dependent methyltransferase
MSDALLHHHRAIWQEKPVLRELYAGWYREMAAWLVPGRTLELGGGSGNLKTHAPGVYCTDVVSLPWLDAVVDAQYLPFRSGSLANVVLVDALHHIEQVSLFFNEARRVLAVGGRIIIMDPYISWASWPIYHYLHPEPVEFTHDPLITVPQAGRRPFDSNQAIATMLFERDIARFQIRYPELILRHRMRVAFFAYPLSGGFDHPSLLPAWAVLPMVKVERCLSWLGRWLAFRIMIVLERTGV